MGRGNCAEGGSPGENHSGQNVWEATAQGAIFNWGIFWGGIIQRGTIHW